MIDDNVRPRHSSSRLRAIMAAAFLLVLAVAVGGAPSSHPAGSAPAATSTVHAILPPKSPLPAEAASAGVTRFSFIFYGDTRGRRDGIDLQYDHSLVVDSVLKTIDAMAKGPDPVRFILQTGDAVVDGRDPGQWNVSYVALMNRLTTEGGIPCFLTPGNHDVTSASNLDNPGRQDGLRNYLSAVANLIPPEGASRRLSGYPTYAFGFGNVFVIAIDSNIAGDATQLAWVTGQLEGLDRKRYAHVIAILHHPVFSSGPHGAAVIEPQTASLRALYMPLFRKHHVGLLLAGHEHLFEHWVERYQDSAGRSFRFDEIVSGGGGAPPYGYEGEPDLRDYEKAGAASKVKVEHLVRPGTDPGENPHHYALAHVDGDRLWIEVIGVDWGKGFQPYRSSKQTLGDAKERE